MKVLMCAGNLTPKKGGGIASVINNVIKFTYDKVNYTLIGEYNRVESEEIYDLYPSSVRIELINSFNDYRQLFVHLKRNFDIIHLHGLSHRFFLRLLTGFRTSFVYSHHIAPEQYIKGKFKLASAQTLFNILSRRFKRVIVNSRYCAKRELANFHHLSHKIRIIPNGVDVNLIRNTIPLRLKGHPAILFIGHITYIKGIDILLNAFNSAIRDARVSNAHLHIVGSGDVEHWRKYTNRMSLRDKVHFWGGVKHADAIRILRGADIVISPSRYENFGVALLESMAAGKPIIATNVGGIPEFVKDGINGILTDPSVLQVAKALKYLINNEDLRLVLAANNERDAWQFSWKNIAKKYVSLYKSAMQ